LQDAGLRVWFAPHDIQGGKKFMSRLTKQSGSMTKCYSC
jgi:hypothetical protein